MIYYKFERCSTNMRATNNSDIDNLIENVKSDGYSNLMATSETSNNSNMTVKIEK